MPGLEVVERHFYVCEKFVPQVHGESDVDCGKGGNDVIFGSADITFSKICAVIVGGNVLYSARWGARAEKITDLWGGFVVGYEVGDGVVKGFEEGEDTAKSISIGRSGFTGHGFKVCVAEEDSNKNVFIASARFVRESPREIGSSPVFAWDNVGLGFGGFEVAGREGGRVRLRHTL